MKKTLNMEIKLYGLIGKFLCIAAGGIVGFVFGGLIWTIPGVIAGFICGHSFEKLTMSPKV